MIVSFGNKLTKDVFNLVFTKSLSPEIQSKAFSKLVVMDSAKSINDLRVPFSNHLEKLSGKYHGMYSIRINKQYRICFKLSGINNFQDVEIIDYH